ncbi:MAG: conjugal transfer protein TraN [Variovorax paradoxus]|nr:MAG: conjugal transfer protein TraN [Variovorax paradoxus]PZQ15132.1 MAG: conjugal transfer protein TraN [Variovorax paradoxus]
MQAPALSCCQRLLVWLTLLALAVPPAQADPTAHVEGLAAGQAVQSTIRSSVLSPSAQDVVPGYTATPPERAYHGQPELRGAASTQLTACTLTPNDPVCQAMLGANASAQTPRSPVGAHDPAVLGASRIFGNPSTQLEDIGSFYSGCQVDTVASPATETRVCRQRSGTSTHACARTLVVDVARSSSCAPGEWFAQAGSGSLNLALQCKPDQPSGRQRMRITDRESPMFFDADVAAGYVFPQPVQTLVSEDWRIGLRHLWFVDNRCSGNDCQLTGFIAEPLRRICTSQGDGPESCADERPFFEVYSACPAGTVSGDHIVLPGGEDASTAATLDERSCYAPSLDPKDILGHDGSGTTTSRFWRVASQRAVVGYRQNLRFGPNPPLVLRFERPHTTVTETDQWTDACPSSGGERCTVAAAARCVDGPATREIEGAPVTRACWRYETALSCQFGQPTDDCGPLAAAGCTPSSSVCRETDAATGSCTVTEQTYTCPVAPSTSVTARHCPADVFCIAGSCFNTAAPPDADFARTMAFLEAAREAGVYLDTDLLQVFKGEPNRCRDRLLKNCCTSDGAGRGMHNQSVFGVGSRLVYDVLMNSGNREFLYQGMQALLMSGGFSGSYTTYGVTVAINGTALPAGSSVLYAGESMVVVFDPWSLVIAIVIYVVMSAISCDAEEGQLSMKEGAGLCHAVGTYCSSCIRVLGRCVSCITHTTNKCCFNSALARIIQQQGRQQLGKGWGSARNPDCSGFTVAQLQQLDFARMDLSEFYAAIVPTLPDARAVQGRNLDRAGGCYYGEGRCP